MQEPPMRWLSDWLPDAGQRQLNKEDLSRIAAYAGGAAELHEMLAAVLPLARPVWFEAAVSAHRGTAVILGYGAGPPHGGTDRRVRRQNPGPRPLNLAVGSSPPTARRESGSEAR